MKVSIFDPLFPIFWSSDAILPEKPNILLFWNTLSTPNEIPLLCIKLLIRAEDSSLLPTVILPEIHDAQSLVHCKCWGINFFTGDNKPSSVSAKVSIDGRVN